MKLRYRIIARVLGLLQWYIEWTTRRCPCCDNEMTELVPTGPVCVNPQCEAYGHNLPAARMRASGE